MRDYKVDEVLEENERRRMPREEYDPMRGREADWRVFVTPRWVNTGVWLPKSMVESEEYAELKNSTEYALLRQRHDFEYWAATCVKIRDKESGRKVSFVLNAPQRRVLDVVESDRRAGRPLRLIMLKARQWGGSTLIQMYFAWIQCVLRRRWHSLICAHVRQTSASIRGMYTSMLANYPLKYWREKEPPHLRPFEDSKHTREIAGRECCVTLASSYSQESVRGLDCALAHLSEVAFWKDSDTMTPEDFIRAVSGGIAMVPCSFVALESTANGVGNYFHAEWLRAKRGESDKRAVFVPWYEIEIYRRRPENPERLLKEMTEYEWGLWDKGLNLDMINWYHCKRKEMASDAAMYSEYPTDDVEAFVSTGAGVFGRNDVDRLRRETREPQAVGEVSGRAAVGAGAVEDVKFTPSEKGGLKVWRKPDRNDRRKNRYVAAVDVGGRSAGADWSVVAVIDRYTPDGRPAVVAQWRGHCDADILGWRAAAIAKWYNEALLVVESNSLETASEGSARYILEELNGVYANLYVRASRDTLSPHIESRPGFHTNRATKAVAIATLVSMVRECGYDEPDIDACDEMDVYEQTQNGGYGAKRGYHDDILMTRAIGLYVASTLPITDYADARTLLRKSRW